MWTWRATYADGSRLEEFDARGQPVPWERVERPRLASLSLMDQASGAEVVRLDCATGFVTLAGTRLGFLLGPIALTGRTDVSYREVLQYKSAHADWNDPRGVVIDAHHMGYRLAVPEADVRIVVRLDARTTRASLEVAVTPRGGHAWRGADFVVLAGEPAAGRAILGA